MFYVLIHWTSSLKKKDKDISNISKNVYIPSMEWDIDDVTFLTFWPESDIEKEKKRDAQVNYMKTVAGGAQIIPLQLIYKFFCNQRIVWFSLQRWLSDIELVLFLIIELLILHLGQHILISQQRTGLSDSFSICGSFDGVARGAHVSADVGSSVARKRWVTDRVVRGRTADAAGNRGRMTTSSTDIEHLCPCCVSGWKKPSRTRWHCVRDWDIRYLETYRLIENILVRGLRNEDFFGFREIRQKIANSGVKKMGIFL